MNVVKLQDIEESYFATSDGWELRVLNFGARQSPRILFLPGWASTIYRWRYVLPILARSYNITYFESREKAWTKPGGNPLDLGIDAMARDLDEFCRTRNFDAVVAASVGATVLLHLLNTLRAVPLGNLVLVSPAIKVRVPAYIDIVCLFPIWSLRVVRLVILKVIQWATWGKNTHRIASLVKRRSVAAIDRARHSAKLLRGFELDPSIAKRLGGRVLVVSARFDEFHDNAAIERFTRGIPAVEQVELQTFTQTHSGRLARVIIEWWSRTLSNARTADAPESDQETAAGPPFS